MVGSGFKLWVYSLLLVCSFCACSNNISSNSSSLENNNLSPWLKQQIEEIKQKAPANPPVKIYRYTYNNQEVVYITGYCCDVPGRLYSIKGDLICEPDGGITGRGDGSCPDFFEKRQEETLIWEDKRES